MRVTEKCLSARSFSEHAGIVAALEVGDWPEAERRMAAHLGAWEAKLQILAKPDPLAQLREALALVEHSARILRTRLTVKKRKEATSFPQPAPQPARNCPDGR